MTLPTGWRRKFTLNELLVNCKAGQLHGETDFGPDVGRELLHETTSFTWNPMDPIKFHRVGDDYGWLSNSAPYPISLVSKMWYTAEHYFQAQKFHDQAVQKEILKTRSAADMIRIAANPKLRLRRDWKEVRVDCMQTAVRAKFTQITDLRQLLIGTGDAELIAHTADDSYWGDGGDGSGKNMLGLILMDLRDELRQASVE